MKSDKYHIFCIIIIKALKNVTTIYQVIIIMEKNIILIRDSISLCLTFDWPNDVDVWNMKSNLSEKAMNL